MSNENQLLSDILAILKGYTPGGGGGPPTGAASNGLSGTYPGPDIALLDGNLISIANLAALLASLTVNSVATDMTLSSDGSGNVTGIATLNISALPTIDPSIAGQVWNNGGVLMISGG